MELEEELLSHPSKNSNYKRYLCVKRRWRKGTFLWCWKKSKYVQSLWKTVWSLLKKRKLELPHNLENPLLGIYAKEI